MRFLDSLKGFHNDESGQGMVEYILVVCFIALAAIAGMKSAANYINNAFNIMGGRVNNAVGS
jgi:Flp pilus assembly pilin Flp